MTIKYISNHWATGGVRRLNTKTGRSHRSLKYSWGEAPDKGWAYRLGFKWYFHYQHNDQWYFQNKNIIIPTKDGPDLKGKFKHDFNLEKAGDRHRKFTIKRGDDVVFQLTYKYKGYWASRFDPTYDFIDASNDDPFLHLIDWGDE